jgi:predicted nucleic acid-binding protein
MSVKTERSSEGSRVVVDTYAWIEYFRGSDEGRRAAKIIDSESILLTPSIVIAELSDKYRRSGLSEAWEKQRLPFIGVKSSIVPIDQTIADLAGKLKLEKRKEFVDFGLGDALVLATAKEFSSQLLTGDRHLKKDESAIDITE